MFHSAFIHSNPSLTISSRNPLTRPQLHDRQNENPNWANQSILPALVPGLAKLACIVSSGILGMDLLLQGCWLLGRHLGYVESMCFGEDGRRKRFRMEAWRILEWRMVMRWRLTRKRRKILIRDLLRWLCKGTVFVLSITRSLV